MHGLKEYTIGGRGALWPADEAMISPEGGRAVAVCRLEPWPEVHTRPWPDGAKGRPWLIRLFGAGRDPNPSRIVLRRLSDGSPLLRLHERSPAFSQTVGIFDVNDVRVGYFSWGSKGGSGPSRFRIHRTDHLAVGTVAPTNPGEFRVSGIDGTIWATVALTGGTVRVTQAPSLDAVGSNEILTDAAAMVLFLKRSELEKSDR